MEEDINIVMYFSKIPIVSINLIMRYCLMNQIQYFHCRLHVIFLFWQMGTMKSECILMNTLREAFLSSLMETLDIIFLYNGETQLIVSRCLYVIGEQFKV